MSVPVEHDERIEKMLIFKVGLTFFGIPVLVAMMLAAALWDALVDAGGLIVDDVPKLLRHIWRHEIKETNKL